MQNSSHSISRNQIKRGFVLSRVSDRKNLRTELFLVVYLLCIHGKIKVVQTLAWTSHMVDSNPSLLNIECVHKVLIKWLFSKFVFKMYGTSFFVNISRYLQKKSFTSRDPSPMWTVSDKPACEYLRPYFSGMKRASKFQKVKVSPFGRKYGPSFRLGIEGVKRQSWAVDLRQCLPYVCAIDDLAYGKK